MKTIAIIFLFLTASLPAQNLDFATKLNHIEPNALNEVSNEIISSLNGNFRIVAQIEEEQTIYFLLYPSTISDEKANADIYTWKQNCQDCLRLEFGYYETETSKKYHFKEITASYEILFPFWQKNFAPGATMASLKKEDSKLRYIKNFKPDVDIRFVEDQGEWIIRNVK